MHWFLYIVYAILLHIAYCILKLNVSQGGQCLLPRKCWLHLFYNIFYNIICVIQRLITFLLRFYKCECIYAGPYTPVVVVCMMMFLFTIYRTIPSVPKVLNTHRQVVWSLYCCLSAAVERRVSAPSGSRRLWALQSCVCLRVWSRFSRKTQHFKRNSTPTVLQKESKVLTSFLNTASTYCTSKCFTINS